MTRRDMMKRALAGLAAAAGGKDLEPRGVPAMPEEELDPLTLFPAACRFDGAWNKPAPRVYEGPDLLRGRGMNVFALGSGAQLTAWCASLLAELRDLSLREFGDDIWTRQGRELWRLFHEFFRAGFGNPALLATHTTYWSERAVLRHVYGRGFLRAWDAPASFPLGQGVPLRFESPGLLGGASGERQVTVETSAIQWLGPCDWSRPRLARIAETIESRKTWQGLAPQSVWHRESLGAVTGKCDADYRWFKLGVYPGLAGLVHCLSKDGAGELRARQQVLNEPPRWQGPPPGETPLDVAGVLDVYVLKGWRMFKRRPFGDRERVWYDELFVALDRAGFVAFITVACKRLPSELTEHGEFYLVEWLRQNWPSSRSRRA